MNDKAKPKRKIVERREAGIKAMPAPPPRTLPKDHPARSMFRQVAEAERNQAETLTTSTTTPTTSVAPTRDFTRVPNSIVREAIPAGYFTGKSKQIYDCLYAMTRGAVMPVRSVRISMERLMVKADIGSDRTLRKNLARLEGVGLVTIRQIGGTQGGNGNSGVASIVKSTDGAIGYVDLADAKASNLQFAQIKNADGKYQAPTLDGADPPDEIGNGRIDLGALTAEFLALGLDPYPRKPGVSFGESAPSDRSDSPSYHPSNFLVHWTSL